MGSRLCELQFTGSGYGTVDCGTSVQCCQFCNMWELMFRSWREEGYPGVDMLGTISQHNVYHFHPGSHLLRLDICFKVLW